MRQRKIRIPGSPLTLLLLNSIHFCNDEIIYCKFALVGGGCLFQKEGFRSFDSCILETEELEAEYKRLRGEWPYQLDIDPLDFMYEEYKK
jgi:hypothetical protein